MSDAEFAGFEPSANGTYMIRWGPKKGVPPEERSDKKLCLTATDRALWAQVVSELSEHPQCRAVKFSVEPKDGMYLGRAFILDDDELGRLWQKYKRHPRLMCSIQDDDFVRQFRPD